MSSFGHAGLFRSVLVLCFMLAGCSENAPGQPSTGIAQPGKPPPVHRLPNERQDPPPPMIDSEPSEIIANRLKRPPKYPVQSVRDRAEGKVVLKVLVSADGKPEEITLEGSSGSEDLDRAAITAVKTWDFNPGLKKGVAVPAYLIVPVEFNLNQ